MNALKFFVIPRRHFSISLPVSVREALGLGGIFVFFLVEPFGERKFLIESRLVTHLLGQVDVTTDLVDGVKLVGVVVNGWGGKGTG